jgi:hypothetical protein
MRERERERTKRKVRERGGGRATVCTLDSVVWEAICVLDEGEDHLMVGLHGEEVVQGEAGSAESHNEVQALPPEPGACEKVVCNCLWYQAEGAVGEWG